MKPFPEIWADQSVGATAAARQPHCDPRHGGRGRIHLITLARLGIGSFRVADPDTFNVANFNRQMGAEVGRWVN